VDDRGEGVEDTPDLYEVSESSVSKTGSDQQIYGEAQSIEDSFETTGL
jgi:hypothetical protein